MQNDRQKILEYKKRRDARLAKRGLIDVLENRMDSVGAFYERRNKRRSERNLPEINKPVDRCGKKWYNEDESRDVINGEKVNWKTADNGKHYAINGEGEIVAGPDALKGVDLTGRGGGGSSRSSGGSSAQSSQPTSTSSAQGGQAGTSKPKVYKPSANYERFRREAAEKIGGLFPSDSEHSTGVNYAKITVPLKIQSEEAQALFNKLQDESQEITLDELRENPVVRQMDELSRKCTEMLGGETYLINTPEREELRQEIRERFMSLGSARVNPETGKTEAFDGEIRREFKCVIYTGLPAAGKSTVLDPLSQEMGAFVYDNDTVKTMIPEFEASGGAAAGAVHEESSMIQKSCLREFMAGGSRNGDNIAYPCIGDNSSKLMKNIKMFEEAGYQVEVRCLDVPAEMSCRRVVARGIETGRIIDSKIVLGYGDKPTKAYHELEKFDEENGTHYARQIVTKKK